jgi:hypothetical protein
MITPEKMAIWREFSGDEDRWQLAGRPGRDIIADGDWGDIRTLFQQATLLKKGLASEEYAATIRKNLSEMSSDVNVAQYIFDTS